MHKDFQKKVEIFTSFSEILNIRGPYETNIRRKRLFFGASRDCTFTGDFQRGVRENNRSFYTTYMKIIYKSFYVKFERKIPALIADLCTYYAPHANHSVIYYYDATALGSNYAVNDQDFHWVVVHEFERHGWSVQDVYLGNPMRHDEKYLLINQGFSGKQRLMPYFNRQNNDDIILAIQSAGVERGRNGFRKNKSSEKNPESEEDLLEHRTDGTDAFDTLYIGCEKFPQHDFYGVAVGGVR